MIYITCMQSPSYKQLSFEDLLFGEEDCGGLISLNETNTLTREFYKVPKKIKEAVDVQFLIRKLTDFNTKYEKLKSEDRTSLYNTFYIPKKSGGLRRIDAPLPALMDALRELKSIFENDFKALYHTSSFAYIKGRSTVDSIKRHQGNQSRWFGKLDLSNFFGSTSIEYVYKMFSMIFPFSEVCLDPLGSEELLKAIDLAFLNGGLPQGTPVSPLITNVMMIPVDFSISRRLRKFDNKFVYTRYADDFLISSKFSFNINEIEAAIKEVLHNFEAPFSINEKKTRYGSSAGSNWNLGVMLNKDNKITVGYRKKKQFKAMLANYAMDNNNGVKWPIEDVRTLDGYRSYYKMIEGDTIDYIVGKLSQKFNVNIVECIREDLKRSD